MAGKGAFIKRYQMLTTSRIMQLVMLACVPGLAALTLFFGWGSLINIVWLCLWALLFEAMALRYRRRDIRRHLTDGSALLTAVLLGLSLPPATPWWAGITGIFFAIVIAKHCYGGLGYNIFNPAMVGYVVLLIAFPLETSTWILPSGANESLPAFTDSLAAIFQPDGGESIDAYTGATLLDTFKQRGALQVGEFRAQSALSGAWSAQGWEWVNLGFLAGGLYLLQRRIIAWHIPVSMLLTLALLAALFYDGGSSASGGSPLMHLLAGGTMLGAFFIATDPVTAAASPRGRLVYGAMIGAVTYSIRAWGGYPDGIAFAVLLGNFAVPLIDYYSKPGMPGSSGLMKREALRSVLGHGLTLAAFAAFAALLLALAWAASSERIEQQAQRARQQALNEVLPAELHDNDLLADQVLLDPRASAYRSIELLGLREAEAGHIARLGGEFSGLILPVTAREGYSGDIRLLVAILADGTISGVRVTGHRETPGLGDKIDLRYSDWILDFNGRSLNNPEPPRWTVRKEGGDFDQFTGATITPRAVAAAVRNALAFFEANRDLFMGEG